MVAKSESLVGPGLEPVTKTVDPSGLVAKALA
jgi:hypothetical protein